MTQRVTGTPPYVNVGASIPGCNFIAQKIAHHPLCKCLGFSSKTSACRQVRMLDYDVVVTSATKHVSLICHALGDKPDGSGTADARLTAKITPRIKTLTVVSVEMCFFSAITPRKASREI
ncbi:hypothetical protein HPB50_008514 [Hyalomma asiaticum]|uniref:Uncharacterized protein n=1 Tax=Hyalomma asiaticum TaxID=266040 RepID=A0ACB7T3X4_HYAAI|nr:hypothetical protein HPB50_008514 [Hyalomma asiaticum]